MKIKEDYRYQFIGFETIETGKYTKRSIIGGLGLLGTNGDSFLEIPITKVVGTVFDKKLGTVKHTEIEKTDGFIHGYSGDCPKPPLKTIQTIKRKWLEIKKTAKRFSECRHSSCLSRAVAKLDDMKVAVKKKK